MATAKMQGKVHYMSQYELSCFLGVNDKYKYKPLNFLHPHPAVSAGKVVHGETTTAHAVLNGTQYYHQDWSYAAAHVTVPPLRLDPTTPNALMSLLGRYGRGFCFCFFSPISHQLFISQHVTLLLTATH